MEMVVRGNAVFDVGSHFYSKERVTPHDHNMQQEIIGSHEYDYQTEPNIVVNKGPYVKVMYPMVLTTIPGLSTSRLLWIFFHFWASQPCKAE